MLLLSASLALHLCYLDGMQESDFSKPLAGGRIVFLGSFSDPSRLPAPELPEIAFAGRSNVGKSSAINRLLNAKVARVARTPGRTQMINLFRVESRLHFVDLPGYGFAKVPEAMRASWKDLIEGYLGARPTLRRVVVLVDSRLDPQRLDAEMLWGLRQAGLPLLVLATKIDKLSRNQAASNMARLRRDFGLKEHEMIGFSSLSGQGLDLAWAAINAAVEGA